MIWDLIAYAARFTLLSAYVALIYASFSAAADGLWEPYIIYFTLAWIMYHLWTRTEARR